MVGTNIKTGEMAEYRRSLGRKDAIESGGILANVCDGAAINDVDVLKVTAADEAEILLVDAT